MLDRWSIGLKRYSHPRWFTLGEFLMDVSGRRLSCLLAVSVLLISFERYANDGQNRSAAVVANVTDSTDSIDPVESDAVEVPIDRWGSILTHLERFAGDRGDVSAIENTRLCDFGNAHFEIRRDGIVSAGMALHDIEQADVAALRFDHANGAVTVLSAEADDERDGPERFEYTFRQP